MLKWDIPEGLLRMNQHFGRKLVHDDDESTGWLVRGIGPKTRNRSAQIVMVLSASDVP